jgi:hypothetical protein
VNLARMIAEQQREAVASRRQSFQHGVVTGYDQGQYRVNVTGTLYLAESITADRFLPGDRVYLALGRGTPRILGLLGKDENAL